MIIGPSLASVCGHLPSCYLHESEEEELRWMNKIHTRSFLGVMTGVERYLILVDGSNTAFKIEVFIKLDRLMTEEVCHRVCLRDS